MTNRISGFGYRLWRIDLRLLSDERSGLSHGSPDNHEEGLP